MAAELDVSPSYLNLSGLYWQRNGAGAHSGNTLLSKCRRCAALCDHPLMQRAAVDVRHVEQDPACSAAATTALTSL